MRQDCVYPPLGFMRSGTKRTQIPSCSRCISKGLICEARRTKRASDAATRIARKEFSLYRRPVPIVSAINGMPSPPTTNPFMTVPDPLSTWDCYSTPTWLYGSLSPMAYPYTPPNASTQLGFQPGFLNTAEPSPNNLDFTFPQPSPTSVYSSPAFLKTGAVQSVAVPSPALSLAVSRSEPDTSITTTLSGFDTTSSYGEPSLSFD